MYPSQVILYSRCHTKKKDLCQSFFRYDNDRDLKRCTFVGHASHELLILDTDCLLGSEEASSVSTRASSLESSVRQSAVTVISTADHISSLSPTSPGKVTTKSSAESDYY